MFQMGNMYLLRSPVIYCCMRVRPGGPALLVAALGLANMRLGFSHEDTKQKLRGDWSVCKLSVQLR